MTVCCQWIHGGTPCKRSHQQNFNCGSRVILLLSRSSVLSRQHESKMLSLCREQDSTPMYAITMLTAVGLRQSVSPLLFIKPARGSKTRAKPCQPP